MKTHKSILKEAEDFNDIIIGDFYDTYENLPLKTYLGYQFYHDQCKVSNISRYVIYPYGMGHTVLVIWEIWKACYVTEDYPSKF